MLTFIVACIIIVLFVLSYAAESHDDGYSDNGKTYKKPKTDIRRKNTQDVVPLYRKGNKKKATVPTYKIRQPQEKIPIKKLKPTIILDDKKLEDLKHQTQIAQQLLSDIFIEEENKYERLRESFSERAYPLEDIAKWLGESGFEVTGIYDDMTENAPSEVSERVYFTAVKR